jgi:PDZ domain-containing secreted protein
LAIGGVKEKVLAAKRSNIQYIIFPKANYYDWEELEVTNYHFAFALYRPKLIFFNNRDT